MTTMRERCLRRMRSSESWSSFWSDDDALKLVDAVLSEIDIPSIKSAARAQAIEEAAKVATSFLVGDPKNGVPLRNPMAHEIAYAIRALTKAPE